MSALPPVHATVVHLLHDAATKNPDGEALVCGTERLTYSQYLGAVSSFARELVANGMAGERVALLMSNSIDIAVATFAVQAAGAQVVPLNPAYTAHELLPILRDAAPAMLIYDAALEATVAPVATEAGITRTLTIGAGARRLNSGDGPLPQFPDPQSLSTLQYTGGTTGRSKGVDLTHRAIATNISQREALLPTEKDSDRVLAITPLFHVYATAMCLYLAAYCRGTLVILPRYHPRLVLEAIAQERISLLASSPTIFSGLMGYEDFAGADFSSLRLCYSGASALSPELLRRWQDATGTIICEGFGQTETGPVLAFNPANGVRKPGSVGIIVPQTQVEIADTTNGDTQVGTGQQGEIRARGPQLMSGYRNMPGQTASALRKGWLYTGDIGWMDEDGYLHISDRKKDMVIVGGFNVYPREVEDALHLHAGVAEAAVIGRPDLYRGESLYAYVVPRSNAPLSSEVLAAHLSQLLTAYKLPKHIEIVAVLPKTAIGKIDKDQLRRQSAAPAKTE